MYRMTVLKKKDKEVGGEYKIVSKVKGEYDKLYNIGRKLVELGFKCYIVYPN